MNPTINRISHIDNIFFQLCQLATIILGACVVGLTGIVFASNSSWITASTQEVVNLSKGSTPATSSMNAIAVLEFCWLPGIMNQSEPVEEAANRTDPRTQRGGSTSSTQKLNASWTVCEHQTHWCGSTGPAWPPIIPPSGISLFSSASFLAVGRA